MRALACLLALCMGCSSIKVVIPVQDSESVYDTPSPHPSSSFSPPSQSPPLPSSFSVRVLGPEDAREIEQLMYNRLNTRCSRVTEVEFSESSTNIKAVCTCMISTYPQLCGGSEATSSVFRTADFVKNNSGWHISLRPPDLF